MFGRTKEIDPASIRKDVETASKASVSSLPDFLVARFSGFENLVQEYNELQRTLNTIKLPRGQKDVFRQRIRDLESSMWGAQRIAEILRRGYEPFTMPDAFYAGTIDLPSSPRIRLQFMAPMPTEVLKAYHEAKSTKLFDEFLVGAADRELFRVVSPRACEPVLVGYARTEKYRGMALSNNSDRWGIAPGIEAKDGTGFLIAYWDLSKDLKRIIGGA